MWNGLGQTAGNIHVGTAQPMRAAAVAAPTCAQRSAAASSALLTHAAPCRDGRLLDGTVAASAPRTSGSFGGGMSFPATAAAPVQLATQMPRCCASRSPLTSAAQIPWAFSRWSSPPPRHAGRAPGAGVEPRIPAAAATGPAATAATTPGPPEPPLLNRPLLPGASKRRSVPTLLPVPGEEQQQIRQQRRRRRDDAAEHQPGATSALRSSSEDSSDSAPTDTSAGPAATAPPAAAAKASSGGSTSTGTSSLLLHDNSSRPTREDWRVPPPMAQLELLAGAGEPAQQPPATPQAAPPAKRQSTQQQRRGVPRFSDDDPQVAAAYDSLPVSVSGREPPAPLLSYNDLAVLWKVPPLLLRNAAGAFRLSRPTPIQSHVIPAVLEGRDVLAVSCTGSGKTLSYLLPTLAQLMGRNRHGTKNSAAPDALILVPTRELAEQVFADVQLLIRGSHLKAMVLHGGVSIAEQVLAIRGKRHRSRGGVDLVVATPGRLLQLVEQRRAVRLGRLGAVVVDEADQMMDLALWPDLKRLLSHPDLPTARQTVLVAAARPGGELEGLAGQLLRDRVAVVVGDGDGASGVVQQHVELLSEEGKMARLVELLAPGASGGVARAAGGAAAAGGGGGPAVVFAHSLVRAEEVARQLAARGVGVALLHRDLTQEQRDEAMQCFRFGVTSVLVASTLASRGLNFPDVAHVVNYDVPPSASAYVHQVGRTGRGGRPGRSTTLVTRSNRAAAPWLSEALRRSGTAVPPWLERMAEAAAAVAARRAAVAAGTPMPVAAGPSKPAAAAGASRGSGGSIPSRWPVEMDDPAAALAVGFGSYLPGADQGATQVASSRPHPSNNNSSASQGASSAGSAQRQPPSAPPGPSAGARAAADRRLSGGGGGAQAAVVLDRRHDAAHWQAVFDEALRPLQRAPPAAPGRQSASSGGTRSGRRAQSRTPAESGPAVAGAAPASGSDDPAAGGRRRLLEDGAVKLQARTSGGLTAGGVGP